jgi:hypothetical protein
MMRKLVATAVAITSTMAGLIVAGDRVTVAQARRSDGCGTLPAFDRGAPGLAGGRGLWAVASGELVSVADGRSVPMERLAAISNDPPAARSMGGTIKHVSVRAGIGTAYVIDRTGADVIVTVTRNGVRFLPQPTEASQPAWSPTGRLAWSTGDEVVVTDLGSDRTIQLSGPIRGSSIFAPVFLSDRRIAAVVSASSKGAASEGERLGNLWATGVSHARWRRITNFRARGDRWVTIRTPIARAGGIDFVRVSGRASSTRDPHFELWRYEHGTAARVERLDGEQYLAGRLSGRIVWNRPDPLHERNVLQVEGRRGMTTIGCGAVLVDPIEGPDPDRRSGGSLVPARGTWSGLKTSAAGIALEAIAVLVGDFKTAAEAEAVATVIQGAYPASRVEVVDNADAPLAIRPGVFAAMLHLPQEADPTAALARFRAALPGYADNSWIVTP